MAHRGYKLISYHLVVLLNFDNIMVLGTVCSLKFLGLVTHFSFYVQLFTLAAKLTCELSRKKVMKSALD